MSAFNPFDGGSNSALVDRALSKSYDVVKEVYNNLEELKEIPSLVNDPSVSFLKTNLDIFKTANSNASELKGLSDDKDKLLNTPSEIEKIKKQTQEDFASELSKANSFLSQTQEQVEASNRLYNKWATSVDVVVGIQDEIHIVASNAGHIKTVSKDIGNVNKVADYLKCSSGEAEVVPDWGVIGSELDSNLPNSCKSPIDIIAEHIHAINEVYQHLDGIIDLIELGGIENIDKLSKQIKEYLCDINKQSQKIELHLKELYKQIEVLDSKYLNIVDGLQKLKTDILEAINAKIEQINSLVEKADNYSETAKQYSELCAKKCLEIKQQYIYISKALEELERKYIVQISKVGEQTLADLRKELDLIYLQIQTKLEFKVDEAIKLFLEKIEKEVNKQVDKVVQDALDKADEMLLNIYRFKGHVNTFEDLLKIDSPRVGDVYDVREYGVNYAFTYEGWDSLGAEYQKDFGIIGS